MSFCLGAYAYTAQANNWLCVSWMHKFEVIDYTGYFDENNLLQKSVEYRSNMIEFEESL